METQGQHPAVVVYKTVDEPWMHEPLHVAIRRNAETRAVVYPPVPSSKTGRIFVAGILATFLFAMNRSSSR